MTINLKTAVVGLSLLVSGISQSVASVTYKLEGLGYEYDPLMDKITLSSPVSLSLTLDSFITQQVNLSAWNLDNCSYGSGPCNSVSFNTATTGFGQQAQSLALNYRGGSSVWFFDASKVLPLSTPGVYQSLDRDKTTLTVSLSPVPEVDTKSLICIGLLSIGLAITRRKSS